MTAMRKFVAALTGALGRREQVDVVSVAQALADSGQFDEAIAYATTENSRARNATLERNLALWRNQAFGGIDRSQHRSQWPPVFADPFPENQALPELPAAQLDLAHLGGGITHHGGLIVRGLLSAQEAQHFVAGIDQAMAVRATNAPDDESWYAPFPLPHNQKLRETRPWVESGGGLWTVDSPRMLFDLMELLKR
jgi:hypothetical protein